MTVRGTVHGDSDPHAIEEEFLRLGVRSYKISKSSPVMLASKDKALISSIDKKISERMITLFQKQGHDLLISIKNKIVLENVITSQLINLIFKYKRYYGCGVGKTIAGISVNGDIYPCHRFVGIEEAKIGNIKNYVFREKNVFYQNSIDKITGCQTCWVRYFCGGGCCYDNKARSGDIKIADPLNCKEIKALVEIAIVTYLKLTDEDKNFLKTAYEISSSK